MSNNRNILNGLLDLLILTIPVPSGGSGMIGCNIDC